MSKNYEFYLRFDALVGFAGRKIVADYAADGRSAKEAFRLYDAQGKRVPTCEPDLLARAIAGKAGVNLQIKEWGRGLGLGVSTLGELRHYWQSIKAPKWVERSTINQAYRRGWLSDAWGRDQVGVLLGFLEEKEVNSKQ